MGNGIQFTSVQLYVEGKPYTVKVEDGMALCDKDGDIYLFRNGKCQLWNSSYRRNGEGQEYGKFINCVFNLPVHMGKESKKALDAIMDNDGNASTLTRSDFETARQQFTQGQLGKDFEKHGAKFSSYQEDDCGIRWGGLCLPNAEHLKRRLKGENESSEIIRLDYVPEEKTNFQRIFGSLFK